MIPKLRGALELALFMGQGLDFFSNDKREMLRSFVIPVLLFPLTLLTVYVAQRPEIAGTDFGIVMVLYLVRACLTMAMVIGLYYGVGRALDRHKDFFKFLTVSNWLALLEAFISLPILYLFVNNTEWPTIYTLLIMLSLYGYALIAFLFRNIYRLSWELSIALAIVVLAINNISLEVLFTISQALAG